MRHLLAALMFALLALGAPAAHAQCEGTWDNARVSKLLDEAAAALGGADLATAKTVLNEVDTGIGCLEDRMTAELLARYARSVALLRFYEQDETQAIKWGVYGRALDPDGTWPGELPEGHPFLALLAEEPEPTLARAEGWLVPPEKGAVLINGRFAAEPEAWPDLPALVQLFDKVGYPIETFWQDGIAFRDDLLSDEGGPVEPPGYYNPATGHLKVAKKPAKVKLEKIKVEKAPSDFPVVPVATAGGLAALSGLSYALAGAAAAGLENAENTEELTRARSTTNTLVVISAATGAGALGVGLGTWLADGEAGVRWTVRF